MERDNVIYMPAPRELTPEQRDHWESTLEAAERLRENSLRMLGRLPIEYPPEYQTDTLF